MAFFLVVGVAIAIAVASVHRDDDMLVDHVHATITMTTKEEMMPKYQ